MGNKLNKKRIAVFASYFYPHLGGYEKNIEELFRRISKKTECEADVICFNTEKVSKFERVGDLNIYRINCWNLLGGTYAIPKLGAWRKVKNKIKENDYLFVSTQTRFFFTSFLGYLFAKKNNIRLVHTERGTSHVKQGNFIVRIIAYVFDQIIGRLIISQADAVTGVSQTACDFAKKLGAKNPAKIFNGIDSEFWRKIEEMPADVTNDVFNKTVITFVGRIIEAKGVQDLLKAASQLNQNKFNLLIVGGGNYMESLKKMSGDKLGLRNVYFLGEKKPEEVIKILSHSDIFVNPSYTEGLPTSVIEAGACECAVIASDAGGTREIINHGENGYIFKPKDIIGLKENLEKLIGDKEKRISFGKDLRQKITAKFDWDKIVGEYLKIAINGK